MAAPTFSPRSEPRRQRRGMRWLSVGLVLPSFLGVAPAEARCLSGWEIPEAIAQGRAVEPTVAVLAARRVVTEGDLLRGRLCQDGAGLIYEILILRKDGRLVHVTINASSGKVIDNR